MRMRMRMRCVLQGCVLEEYSQGVEEKLRALELESIQDYIAESDNLVDLHQQVISMLAAAAVGISSAPTSTQQDEQCG
jgi:hypothetical protein